MSRTLEYFTSRPWALDPHVLRELHALLVRHATGDRLERAEVEAIVSARLDRRGGEAAELEPQVLDGVAIVPVRGVIAKHASQVGGVSQPRGTSVEAIRKQLRSALADDTVRAILLDVDSPGGVADGVDDLAAELYAARKSKPLFAIADGTAASAAYYLASQAETVFATTDAAVGSIGVYIAVHDSSKLYADRGVKVHLVATGPHKGAGMPGTEITDEQIGVLRELVQEHFRMFKAAVARGRGERVESVDAVATGQVWLGARARAQGLVDKIGTFEKALDAARRAGRAAAEDGASARLAVPGGETNTDTAARGAPEAGAREGDPETRETIEPMTTEPTPAAPSVDLASLSAAQLAELSPAAVQSIRDAALAEGAEAERARITTISSEALDGQAELATRLIAEGTSIDEARRELLADAKARNAASLAALRAERGDAAASGAGDPDTYTEPERPSGRSIDEAAAEAWANLEPHVRLSYPSESAFVALFKTDPDFAVGRNDKTGA